jgi:hypothetical protein
LFIKTTSANKAAPEWIAQNINNGQICASSSLHNPASAAVVKLLQASSLKNFMGEKLSKMKNTHRTVI